MNQENLGQGSTIGYAGQRWLVEERDACGVGFLADQKGRASHRLVEQALSALTCLEHRGGCSADQDSGDGAGLMTAMPWELLNPWFAAQGIQVSTTATIGVGMVFLPQDAVAATQARQIVERVIAEEGLTLLGWRVVPVRPEVLGVQARQNQPQIEAGFGAVRTARRRPRAAALPDPAANFAPWWPQKSTVRLSKAYLKTFTFALSLTGRSSTRAWCDRQSWARSTPT